MSQATKLDLRRELKTLYAPPAGRPVLVDVPELSFLMVDGEGDPRAAGRVRLEPFCEGRAAQLLHHGPFSTEGPTIQRLHGFIDQQGLGRRGKHHEIYLTDLTRTAPERLKTVIRQPVTD
jgi:hypothetical protein